MLICLLFCAVKLFQRTVLHLSVIALLLLTFA